MTEDDTIFIIGDGPHSHEIAELVSRVINSKQIRLGPADQMQLEPGSLMVLGLGVAAQRLRALDELEATGTFLRIVAPSAFVSDTARIGVGAVICSGSIVSTNATVSDGVLINWNVTVGHDVVLGRGSVINPQAAISGGVTTGVGCLVGAGAVILQGVNLGHYCIIGAGAVVTKDVSDYEVVIGVPGRVIPGLTEKHRLSLGN